MAFSYGFYNSLNGDRKYNARQFSDLFNAMIKDGVFSTVGEILATVAGTGMQVIVKTGMAWFDSTWNLNDSWMPFTIAPADISLPRYDTIVLEVMETDEYRSNSIKLIKGSAAVNPVKPALVNTETIHQHPLAHIRVNGGVTSITDANIEIVVGKSPCPFVTGFLQSVDITDLYNQWNSQFTAWWDNIKLLLNDNTVGHLQNQIDTLNTNLSKKLDKTTFETWYSDQPKTGGRLMKSRQSNTAKILYEELAAGTSAQFLRGDLTWQAISDVAQNGATLVGGRIYYGSYSGSTSGNPGFGTSTKTLTFDTNLQWIHIIGIGKSNGSYPSHVYEYIFAKNAVGYVDYSNTSGPGKSGYGSISGKSFTNGPDSSDFTYYYMAICAAS